MCPIVRDAASPLPPPPDPTGLPAGGARSLLFAPARAAAQFDDQQVKAAFVLNFLKFVTWPEAPARADAPDRGRRAGRRRPGPGHRAGLGGQQIGGRPIWCAPSAAPRDIGAAPQLLFIAASERDRLPVLLRQFEGRPVLTVGDGAGYGAAGVVLNFYTSDTRIRFEANTTAAARAGLQISSHLLRLARIVG